MAFSFSKLLSNKKEKVTLKQLPELKLTGVTKYAKNDLNDVYLDFEELGGFPFIKTIIVGEISVAYKRVGCQLTFFFKDEQITLNSDNTAVESSQIKNTDVFYTQIDFELTEEELAKIKKRKIKEIEFSFKKSKETFQVL